MDETFPIQTLREVCGISCRRVFVGIPCVVFEEILEGIPQPIHAWLNEKKNRDVSG